MEISQYEDFFQEELKRNGDYDSIFWPKSRAKTMGEKERRGVDGCATFFKASRFPLVEKHLPAFTHIALQGRASKITEDIFNRVMSKDKIACLAFLGTKHSGPRSIIA